MWAGAIGKPKCQVVAGATGVLTAAPGDCVVVTATCIAAAGDELGNGEATVGENVGDEFAAGRADLAGPAGLFAAVAGGLGIVDGGAAARSSDCQALALSMELVGPAEDLCADAAFFTTDQSRLTCFAFKPAAMLDGIPMIFSLEPLSSSELRCH